MKETAVTQYDPDAEPTHTIPRELETKLIEAKRWKDKRQELIDTDFADAHAWTSSVAEGNLLLVELVEIIGDTWGWGPKATGR